MSGYLSEKYLIQTSLSIFGDKKKRRFDTAAVYLSRAFQMGEKGRPGPPGKPR